MTSAPEPRSAIAPGRARPLEILLAAAALGLFTWLLHQSALSGFWRFDDGMHLAFARRHSPWAYFFDPLYTRAFSGNNLTPWNPFLYDLNLWLFGFSPRPFYAHHLFSLTLTAAATYLLLRLWVRPVYALGGAVLFLLGAPTVHIAQKLMVGHYLDGLLFATLALYGFARSARGDGLAFALGGVLAYALATSCKEVYVPLPLVLLALPEADLRRRAVLAAPYFLWSLVYLLWRYQVLGQIVGGYGSGARGFDFSQFSAAMAAIPGMLLGPGLMGGAALLTLLALLIANLWGRGLRWTLLLAALVAVLVPLVPLSQIPGIHRPDRYLFLPWWSFSLLTALLLARLPWGGAWARLALGVVVLSASALQGQRERAELAPDLAHLDTLYRFALDGPPGRVVVPDGIEDPLYLDLVLNGATEARDRSAADRVNILVDATQVPLLRGQGHPVWAYSRDCACLRQLDPDAPGETPELPVRSLRVVPYAPPYPPLLGQSSGRIDRVVQEGARLRIEGWARLQDRDPEQQLILLTRVLPRASQDRAVRRPDVVSALGDPELLHSGFSIQLDYPDAREARRAAESICLVSRSTLTPLALVPDPKRPACKALLAPPL